MNNCLKISHLPVVGNIMQNQSCGYEADYVGFMLK